MSTPTNYATAQAGARLVEVSSEASSISSNATNLLLGRNDMLWLAGDAPQFVTMELLDAPGRPQLRYVGWHVWHDYLTNPKIVQIHSGPFLENMKLVVECSALPGAGTQLWELTSPIPDTHRFVRFTIHASFAPGPTYVNHFCLFSEHPGEAFQDRSEAVTQQQQQQQPTEGTQSAHNTSVPTNQSSAAAAQGDMSFNSPNPVSNLLKELDEDIRMLHPIRAVSPTKTSKLLNAQQQQQQQPLPLPPSLPPGRESIQMSSTEVSPQAMNRLMRQPPPQQQQPSPAPPPPPQVPQPTVPSSAAATSLVISQEARLDALERSMMTLQKTVENQTRELQSLRRELAAGQQDVSQVTEQMLKNFAEEIIAPKLQKHAKRTEAKVLQRVDEHLHRIMQSVSDVAEEQVSQRLHEIVSEEQRQERKKLLKQQQRAAKAHQDSTVNTTASSSGGGQLLDREEMQQQIMAVKKQREAASGRRKNPASTHFGY